MSEGVNTTINGTQPFSCPDRDPTAKKIGKTFAYCLIFLVSLAGNTAIGIIVYKRKTMRTPINLFIINMAMSDLLFPIFSIPRAIQMLYVDSWLIDGPLGQTLCKLAAFLPDISALVSIQSLILVAVDRFGALVFPFRYPLISSKLCSFFVPATWIVAMAVLSPYLFVMKLYGHPGGLRCRMHWNEAFGESFPFKNYFLSILVVFIFIPFLLIATLYVIIFLKLKSQKNPGEQSTNAEKKHRQRERNVLKMATAIVSGLAVCWLPRVIQYLISFFASDITMSCGFQYFSSVAFLMVNTNCAINPCICFSFNRNYRERLKALLT